jgi:hypothetical protein
MFINIIKSYRYVVAVCDSELLGKYFSESMFQLDVKESFFKGKEGKKVRENELIDILQDMQKEDATFNLVGQRTIDAAIKAEIITQENIGEIQGVPFALVLL